MGFELPNIPGLPDLPDIDSALGPAITDFENFSLFTACTEKSAVFTAKTLKLQSVIITARLMIAKIRLIMRPMLLLKQSDIALPNIDLNLDVAISKITAPKVKPLPKCLADTLTGGAISSGSNGMKDILDPFNSAISEVNSMTSSALGPLTSKVNSFLGDVNNGINEVNKMMSSVSKAIIDAGDIALFGAVDDFQKFIENTNFVDNYREWKDIYRCLEKNCKPLRPFLVDESFLFYDEDNKAFIMPIDLNNGRINFLKFFEDLNREEKKQALIIGTRYYQYRASKEAKLREAAKTAKDAGVKDDKNPFAAAADNIIGIKTTDTFNNLF